MTISTEPFLVGLLPTMCPRLANYKTFATVYLFLTLYVPIIAILDIWKTTLFNEGESVVYDGFKYVWLVKG